jgi:hypothetical protein
MGVNSAAVAVLLAEWGLTPSLVLMADTGDEHPETYEYIPVMDAFLAKHGMPAVQVVRKRSKYRSLEHNCLATDSLPSKAYGGSSCSEKWKIEPQRHYCQHWGPARRCWKMGGKVLKVIGYDDGDRDRERYALSLKHQERDARYDYWFPLREARLDREACKAVIRNAGLPVPPKSSCFYCPAKKYDEVRQMKDRHPDLVERAVWMEVNAAQGKHGLRTVRGLGRNWSWTERLANTSPRFAMSHEDELQVLEDHSGRKP